MISSLYSLTRFFQAKPSCPFWIAGRFYPQKDSYFELQSQGLKQVCFLENASNLKAKSQDWIAVEVYKQDKGIFYCKNYQVLSCCEKPYSPDLKSVSLNQDWAQFLEAVYQFFKERGLLHVQTPHLVSCPGTEPHLNPFETKFLGDNQKIFLITSPEMHLKKLLCQDWTDFFEIKTCFRNGESSLTHSPEFQMLEWYRAFFSLNELIQEVFDLILFLSEKSWFKGQKLSCKTYSMQDLFLKHLNFKLTPQTTQKDLLSFLKTTNIPIPKQKTFEDLFHLIFLNCIEPHLDSDQVIAIHNYPPLLRAYSQINAEGWASRFEVYLRGQELGNAFYEVISPQEQTEIFKQHLKERKDQVPPDQELIANMEQGMPPCSGIAIGLNRLFLALTGQNLFFKSSIFNHQNFKKKLL